jgi:hypothetical protein
MVATRIGPSPLGDPNHSPRMAPSTAAGTASLRPSTMSGSAVGNWRRRNRSLVPAPSTVNRSSWPALVAANPVVVATRVVK